MRMFGCHEITQSNVYELGVETAKILNESQSELASIKWTNGEANIDTGYSNLACDCCMKAWDRLKEKNPMYANIYITCVIPDINIIFHYSDGRKSEHKIELKSSKSKKMPGSTIMKLDINQTLIYCLRPTNKSEPYKLKCSQYHSAMVDNTNIDLFQDRTPRPIINFDNMKDDRVFERKKPHYFWIEHYAKCALNRIDTALSRRSWQDDMVKIMKKKIIEDYIRNTSQDQFRIDKISLQLENTTFTVEA